MTNRYVYWLRFCSKPQFGKFILISVFFISMLFFKVQAQDVPYSHFVASGIYLNPSLAGSNLCPRFKLFHREQWTAIPRAYSNTHVFFDWYSNRIGAGLGFSYKNDSQGDGIIQSHHLRAAYSKPIVLDANWLMHAGIYGAYGLRQLNWNKLYFSDQLDPNAGFVNQTGVEMPEHTTIHYPDFGAGFSFSYKDRMYFGFSANHLSMPKINYYDIFTERLNIKYSGHLGYVFFLDDSWSERDWEKNASLTPNLLFEKQGYFYHVTAGLYFSKQPVFAGLWVRHALENFDAIVFNIGFQQPRYKVGYSYDMTISPLTVRSSGGSHELSFTWYLECPPVPEKRRKPLPCPPSFLK